MSQGKSEENLQLDQILEADWAEMCYVGCEIDGFKTIEALSLGSGRWVEHFKIITRGPSGRHYAWFYGSGLTELQDDNYSGGGGRPVYPHKVVRVTTIWKEAPES